MYAGMLSPEAMAFLGINMKDANQIELPPQVRGLFVRTATPAGMPPKSLEDLDIPRWCTICLPTYPNEQEGG